MLLNTKLIEIYFPTFIEVFCYENCGDSPRQCQKTCVLTLVPTLYYELLGATKRSSTCSILESTDSGPANSRSLM